MPNIPLGIKPVDHISEMSPKSPLPSDKLSAELSQTTSEPTPSPDLSLGLGMAFKTRHIRSSGTQSLRAVTEIRETWVSTVPCSVTLGIFVPHSGSISMALRVMRTSPDHVLGQVRVFFSLFFGHTTLHVGS